MKLSLDKSMGYTCIPNSISRFESGLKPAETGILLHLLSHADGYKVSITNISRNMHTDIRTIKKLLDKLENKGYKEILLKVVKNYTINNDAPSKPLKLRKITKSTSIYPPVEISTIDSVNLHQKTVDISTTRINKELTIELIKENCNFIKPVLKEKKKILISSNPSPSNTKFKGVNTETVRGNAQELPSTLTEEFLLAGKAINPHIDLSEKYLSFRASKINKNHVNTDWLNAWTKYLENGIKIYGENKQSTTNITDIGQKMDTIYKPIYDYTEEEKQLKSQELLTKLNQLTEEYIQKKSEFDKEQARLFDLQWESPRGSREWLQLRQKNFDYADQVTNYRDGMEREITNISQSLKRDFGISAKDFHDIESQMAHS